MAADIGLIRAAFQQTAGDRRYLGAGDGVLRLEGSIRIAGDPAAGSCKVDIFDCPVGVRHVGEALAALSQLFKAAGNGGELSAGHRSVGTEAAVRISGDDAELLHIADVVGRPAVLRHIVEGAGIGLIRLDLLGQQAGEHGGHLGAGHVALRSEGTFGVAYQKGGVVAPVQLRRPAVDEGHRRIGLAIHRDAGTADGQLISLVRGYIILRSSLFQQRIGAAADLGEAHDAAGVRGGLIGLPSPAVLQHEGCAGKGLAQSVGLVYRDGRAAGAAATTAGAAGVGVGEGHLVRRRPVIHIIDTVVAFLPLCGVDDKAVVRVRLRLRISGQIIDQRRIYIYDIAALRIGSFRQDVPYRVVIRPVGGTGVLFPDIEALADQITHLIRRAGNDQFAIVIARAVGGDSCRIKFLRVLLHDFDADIEDLQLEVLLSGSGAAA